jgi:HEAT repeat protein
MYTRFCNLGSVERMIEALLESFANDFESDVKVALIRRGIKSTRYVKTISRLLLDPDSRVVREATIWICGYDAIDGYKLERLLEISEDTACSFEAGLLSILECPHEIATQALKNAADAVGDYGIETARGPMLSLLRSKDSKLRIAAAQSTGKIANDEVVSALSYACNDEEQDVIEQHYPDFLSAMEAQDRPLPGYVQDEFEALVQCGRLERGFLRVRCEDCKHEHLVAFSWPLLRIPARAA